jgi:translation initiation factor 5B
MNGEGISDLMGLMIDLVQTYMNANIAIKDTIECTVMDVKPIVGLGTTIDVILANGKLNVHDEIIICGVETPIITKITKLLTPKIGTETKQDNIDYISHKMCVKICAGSLEKAISGSELYVIKNQNDKDKYYNILLNSVNSILSSIPKNMDGLIVQTSTIGSLEAIVMFLNEMKIPISNAGLGTIQKKNIMDVQNIKNKKYEVLLAFDVDISEQAQEMINKTNIKIIKSNIIYELFDLLKKHINNYDAEQKEKNKMAVVFPVKMKIIEVFAKHNPLIVGCKILDGQLKIGTPLCILTGENNEKFVLGKVIGMQINKKDITTGKIGDEVGVKIQCVANNISYGRTIEKESVLYSVITRESIDALKESFKDEMTNNDWKLIISLKKQQNIA